MDEARQAFEDSVFEFYKTARELGAYKDIGGEGDGSRESIFWRKEDGRYGVRDVESAWVGYQLALRDILARYEAVEAQEAASNGGWIKWGGGECPVEDSAPVEVEFRDGSCHKHRYAVFFIWQHHDTDSDIVAYRVVEGGA